MAMPGRQLYWITSLFILAVTSAATHKPNGEERLLREVMRNYMTLARPAPSPAANVTDVSFSLELIRIADYDIVNNVVKINAWMYSSWTDYRLTWDAEKFDGVKQIHLRTSDVWLPDIKLFNGARPEMEMGECRVVVSNAGLVMWIPPVAMEFPCALDHGGTKFNCKAMMGSWTYHGFQVDLKNQKFDASHLIGNPLYNVSELSVARNVQYYPCCQEPYIDITFTFDLGFNEFKPSGGKKKQ